MHAITIQATLFCPKNTKKGETNFFETLNTISSQDFDHLIHISLEVEFLAQKNVLGSRHSMIGHFLFDAFALKKEGT